MQPVGTGPFSVGDAFSWGWTKFTQNAGVIIVAVLIYLLIVAAIEAVLVFLALAPLRQTTCTVDPNTLTTHCTGGVGFFGSLLLNAVSAFVFVVVFAFVQAAVIRGALSIANGQHLELATFFRFENVGNIVVGALIVGAATFVGTLLCFVGAIVVALFTPFWLFFVVDKNMPGYDSVVASVRLVNQHLGNVIVLIIGVFIAYFIGALLCLVGLLVTAPVALLALTYGYRRLQGQPIAA